MNLKELWRSQRSTIISAIIAIVVIAGLFVLFNALPAGQPAEPADKEKQEQTKEEKEAKKDEKKKDKEDAKKDEKVELPSQYTVSQGDHLWDISTRFYGTGYNWTLIAQENRLANPDIIHAGNNLTIPKADKKVSGRTHTVVKGDSLWSIAEKSYGTGFEWAKIRDANSDKVGVLSNGRPLIIPGQTLAIP